MTFLKPTLLYCFFVLPALMLAQTTSVQFQVNMNEQIDRNQFDEAKEFVDIAGSFNGWGDPGLTLNDDDQDGIYTATQNLAIGQGIEFKARINGSWDGREEFPGGGANRTYTVEENGIVEFWYNDEVPNNILQVNISASSNFAIPGEVVQFTDLSNGNPTTWQWSFSGGTPASSTDQNPVISYQHEGSYSVSLTIENQEGESVSRTFENFMTIGNQDTYWWNDAVFYEIFVRSFYDADGDGIGDFQGLIQKLDYLNDGNPATQHDLGVNGIWLMPIHQSPSYHGYDVTDYREIESDYGTNEDFKEFIAAAHERGIKVIIDYVMNHSSSQHPWFLDSKNLSHEKRDWYVWKDTNPGGSGPWGQNVWHQSNGDYYYGLFWGGMPDLNYETPGVKEEMFDISTFWLEEMTVDGFRLDAVKYIYETEAGLEDVAETFQFWKDFRTHYKAVNPDAFSVGEAWTSTNKAREYVGNDGLDYVFEFDLAGGILNAVNNGNAAGLVAKAEEVMGSYPYLQFGSFLSNHDMNRVMNLLGQDVNKARQAAELLLALPGIPYLYYGEEIGMLGVKPDEDIRLPMQWNNTANAGFTTGNPWRAPKPDFTQKNVQAQQNDPNSLWRNYHHLISTRNAQIALRRGNYRTVQTSGNDVYAFLRAYDQDFIITVANVGAASNAAAQISLNGSDITAGEYFLVDLLSGVQESLTVNAGGGFQQQLSEMAAKTTRIYKLLTADKVNTSVELMVNMEEMINAKQFNADTERVVLISSENELNGLELSAASGHGIYSIILNDLAVGTALPYKFGINEVENGREEFSEEDFLRTYRLKESENIVLADYNRKAGVVTAIEEPILTAPSFMVYPNPAKQLLHIQMDHESADIINYLILDSSGSLKQSGVITDTNNQLAIHNLKDGLYFIQLLTGKHIITKKMVVRR